MKISHTPTPPWLRIGWRRPSQSLKEPTTLTLPALGAQTTKRTPGSPPWVIGCAPKM